MTSRSSAPHASPTHRRQDVLRVLLLIGLCSGLVSAALPWISGEIATSVTQVQLLHRKTGPFASVPSEPAVRVLAGINAR